MKLPRTVSAGQTSQAGGMEFAPQNTELEQFDLWKP